MIIEVYHKHRKDLSNRMVDGHNLTEVGDLRFSRA